MQCVSSDNQLADWDSSSTKGARVSYFAYSVKTGESDKLLCTVRAKDADTEALANKAWALFKAGRVGLCQIRAEGIVHYLAIKR
jgi:hypothetical protein